MYKIKFVSNGIPHEKEFSCGISEFKIKVLSLIQTAKKNNIKFDGYILLCYKANQTFFELLYKISTNKTIDSLYYLPDNTKYDIAFIVNDKKTGTKTNINKQSIFWAKVRDILYEYHLNPKRYIVDKIFVTNTITDEIKTLTIENIMKYKFQEL